MEGVEKYLNTHCQDDGGSLAAMGAASHQFQIVPDWAAGEFNAMTSVPVFETASTAGSAARTHAPVGITCAVPAARSLNILLVEDDDADAYLIELALSANPRVAAIVRARDGVEALELVDARQMRPDLAIVDLHMPRKDGFVLLNELKARVTVEFPSVVLSSSNLREDALRSKRRGATRFMTKPSSVKRLTSVLNRVVAKL